MTYRSILTREHFEGRAPDALDIIIFEHLDELPIKPSIIIEKAKELETPTFRYLDSVIISRVHSYNKREITKYVFEPKKKDALDIIILSELSNEPLLGEDIERRLDEDGIPGYTRGEVQARLKFYEELHEAIPTLHGYVGLTEQIGEEDQLGLTFKLCRRPQEKILNKDLNPKHHSYIEDGISREKSHAIPVPKGSRVFVSVYCVYSYKGFSAYYSHIYAYRYKDSPIQSIDYWAYMTEEI